MPRRRYTILVADRTSGVVRRATVSARPAAVVASVAVTLPILIGMGAAWKAKYDVKNLYVSHRALEAENESFRAATASLTNQIAALQLVVTDLGNAAQLEPAVARAIDGLPALVKARAMAMGGPLSPADSREHPNYAKTLAALARPDDTFGAVRSVLEGLASGLDVMKGDVQRRNALAKATPSIFPTLGWLSSTMGVRRDPLDGGNDYHSGIDIAGDPGQPVYATADGVVTQRGYQGNYGNLIVIDHGFELVTKYGHLSAYKVKEGDPVKRGQVIGNIGNTGRSTGYHLHWEVWANGKLINPLQLLTQSKPRDR